MRQFEYSFHNQLLGSDENSALSDIKTKHLGRQFTFPQKEKRTMRTVDNRTRSQQRLTCFDA